MAKLRQVTISQSTFEDFRNYLAGSEGPSLEEFRLVLATMLAPMVGHVRLIPATKDEPGIVLEWSVDSEAKGLASESVIPATEFDRATGAIDSPSRPQGTRDVGLFIGLTVDPKDDSLSIDVATEPVLRGQNLTALAASSSEGPVPLAGDFDMAEGDGLLSAAEVARLLGVDKSTVTRRVRKDLLIGFRVFKNALRIPRGQFRNGDVIPGITEVIGLFKSETSDGITRADHKSAWGFLTSTIYPGDIAPRPIDRLRSVSPNCPISSVVAELALAKQSLDCGDHI